MKQQDSGNAGATPGFGPRSEPVRWHQWGEGLEPQAVMQMEKACLLPVALAGALMPDAHLGYGLPIGGVLATENSVITYAVGVDIACRMKMTVLGIIPGSMASPGFVVSGKGHPDSLNSASHGAGCAMSRKAAHERFNWKDVMGAGVARGYRVAWTPWFDYSSSFLWWLLHHPPRGVDVLCTIFLLVEDVHGVIREVTPELRLVLLIDDLECSLLLLLLQRRFHGVGRAPLRT